ncbi:type II secretion system protein [Eubacterium limosum]|uniref:type II secretion system protein n=1 Tax=Eubacterium limosum TaxID=1736 RepID=UPI0010642F2C|nr:prepilin-type N-terminal cleavage/methylation domain-containing protein [Eubacterium limosum]
MIQLINKLKKNQKGFTLVELIVVLVILAILAAFTIPAMLGFVNDARAKAYLAEAREVKLAYQSAVTDVTTNSKTDVNGNAGDDSGGTVNDVVNGLYNEASKADANGKAYQKVQAKAISFLEGDISNGTTINNGITYYVVVVNAKVVEVRYHRGDYTIIINDAGTTSEKKPMTAPTGNGTLYPAA